MDHDDETALDQLLARVSESALTSLRAVVDVEQRLHDLHRQAGEEPEPPRPAGD